MAHARKDTLTKPREWAKHLRPFGKRRQSKLERKAAQRQIRKRRHDSMCQTPFQMIAAFSLILAVQT